MFAEGVDAFVAEADRSRGRLGPPRLRRRGAAPSWPGTCCRSIGWYHDWLDRAEAGDCVARLPDRRPRRRRRRDQAARWPPAMSPGPEATERFAAEAERYAGAARGRLGPALRLPAGHGDGGPPRRPGLLRVARAHVGPGPRRPGATTGRTARPGCTSRPPTAWPRPPGPRAADEPPERPVGRHARAVGPAMTIARRGVRPRRRRAPLGRRAVNASIEQRHGLAPGSILDTAFAAELGLAAVTGALDYDTWAARVAERLGSPEAVAEWGEFRGHVDPEAVELVGAVRAGGCRVGLLSNATTRLEEDLAFLGLDATFDVVFNTARLGVCKPDHDGLPPRRRRTRRPGRPDRRSPTTPPAGPRPPPRSGSTASPSPASPTSATSSSSLGVRC